MAERLTEPQIDLLRRAARIRGATPYGAEHRVAERLVARKLIRRVYVGGWWPKTYVATEEGHELVASWPRRPRGRDATGSLNGREDR